MAFISGDRLPALPPLPLSVVIISLDEARRIGACLDSVRSIAGDVVVVDAGSRDGTVAVCRRKGARVFERPWPGYAAQKNFGNARARFDWILSLDADERITPALAAELRRVFTGGLECDAYAIRFANHFGRRRIRFGAWNPESHVRLFDRRKLEWNDDDVHEGLCSAGKVRVGWLRGRINHFPVESAAELAAKTARYSALFAKKLRRQGRLPRWWKIWLNPGWRFVRDLVLQGGLLDGRAGLLIAWEAARYTHLKYRLALPVERRSFAPGRLAWGAAAMVAVLLVGFAGLRIREPSGDELAGTRLPAMAMDDDDDDNPPFVLHVDHDILT
jgi:glycosyltransferase involved in cell wall biosynthesis